MDLITILEFIGLIGGIILLATTFRVENITFSHFAAGIVMATLFFAFYFDEEKSSVYNIFIFLIIYVICILLLSEQNARIALATALVFCVTTIHMYHMCS
jgi:hypothetical protein